MNGVMGMADLLLDTALNDEQRFFAKTIQHSSESLLTIINDILDFSKIEADRIELANDDFSLNDLIDSCMQQVAARASSKGLRLIVSNKPDLPCCLKGDSLRIQQVVVNLLGNAVKFTERGQVILELSCENTASHLEPRILRISVKDTGVGIAAEDQKKLFEPFVQVDGSSKRRNDGSGLGLSICHRLVTLMGGELELESEKGKGSAFSFSIPVLDSCRNEERRQEPQKVTSCAFNIVCQNEVLTDLIRSRFQYQDIPHLLLRDTKDLRSVPADHCVFIDAFDFGNHEFEELEDWYSCSGLKAEQVLVALRMNDPFRNRLEAAGIKKVIFHPFRVEEMLSRFQQIESSVFVGSTVESNGGVASIDHGLKLLLVEDNLTNRKLGTILLDKMGHAVESAENGVIALKKLSRQRYDCILMDCMMPEMDGFECTRQIRQGKDGVDPKTHIIAVTANAMKGDREKCLESGMDDYISKPLTRVLLEEALQRCAKKLAIS